MTLLHGMALMAIRAFAASAAKNLQRYAQRPGKRRPALNILGVLMSILMGPVDVIAYSIAPQLSLAPFGMALGLVFDFMAARRVHGEPVSFRDAFSGALVVLGTCICLATGAESDDTSRSAPSLHALAEYTAIVTAGCAFLASAAFSLQRAGGRLDALVYAALGALLGSMTLVSGKVLIASVTRSERSVLEVARNGVATAVLVPTHLFVLNRGFGRHSLVFLSPMSGALQLLFNVSTGYYLYNEVPVHPLQFCAGVALLCGAVAALAGDRSGPEAAGEGVPKAMEAGHLVTDSEEGSSASGGLPEEVPKAMVDVYGGACRLAEGGSGSGRDCCDADNAEGGSGSVV